MPVIPMLVATPPSLSARPLLAPAALNPTKLFQEPLGTPDLHPIEPIYPDVPPVAVLPHLPHLPHMCSPTRPVASHLLVNPLLQPPVAPPLLPLGVPACPSAPATPLQSLPTFDLALTPYLARTEVQLPELPVIASSREVLTPTRDLCFWGIEDLEPNTLGHLPVRMLHTV